MSFTLPELPYAYDALAPYMSKETLEYHHDKHHQAYVTNGNNLLKGTEWEGKTLEEIVRGSFGRTGTLQQRRTALQPYTFLEVDEAAWRRQDFRRPREGACPVLRLGREGYARLDRGWNDAVRFRLGLADRDGRENLATKTPNGENPLVHKGVPILGVDVWEHSYYVDYRNRRPDYLKAFVENLVNWEYVAELYQGATK